MLLLSHFSFCHPCHKRVRDEIGLEFSTSVLRSCCWSVDCCYCWCACLPSPHMMEQQKRRTRQRENTWKCSGERVGVGEGEYLHPRLSCISPLPPPISCSVYPTEVYPHLPRKSFYTPVKPINVHLALSRSLHLHSPLTHTHAKDFLRILLCFLVYNRTVFFFVLLPL